MFTFVPYVFLFSLHSTAHPTIPFLVCCLVAISCLTLCEFMEVLIPFLVQFRSIQLLGCVQLFATPMDCSTPDFPVHHQSWNLLKLMSIESEMPSNHLILCHPLFLPCSVLPVIKVFPNELVLHIRWPKYWSFSLSISPSN